jgi:hypothetical protein
MTARDNCTPTATWVAIDVAKHWNVVLVESAEGRRRFRVANVGLPDLPRHFGC